MDLRVEGGRVLAGGMLQDGDLGIDDGRIAPAGPARPPRDTAPAVPQPPDRETTIYPPVESAHLALPSGATSPAVGAAVALRVIRDKKVDGRRHVYEVDDRCGFVHSIGEADPRTSRLLPDPSFIGFLWKWSGSLTRRRDAGRNGDFFDLTHGASLTQGDHRADQPVDGARCPRHGGCRPPSIQRRRRHGIFPSRSLPKLTE